MDEVKIVVKAGDGGKGCESYIRLSEKKLVPTGGEGGAGGSVIIRADPNITTLKSFLYRRSLIAPSGGAGGSNHKRGKRGQNLVLPVPCGTVVFQRESNFLIRDLVRPGEEVTLLEGGRGGAGSEGGRRAQPGQKGKSLEIVLSLKIPAEVFLVGLPNSGKSKLLNYLTHAHCKEESYPFSTQHPQLGTYGTPDFEQIRLCELPALYRESPEGRGLGIKFLKHLDRAKMILFVLDPLSRFASSLQEGYELLREILVRCQKSFSEIPQGVVVNKMDLAEARQQVAKEKFRPAAPLFLVSAQTGEGMEALMRYVTERLKEVSRA